MLGRVGRSPSNLAAANVTPLSPTGHPNPTLFQSFPLIICSSIELDQACVGSEIHTADQPTEHMEHTIKPQWKCY
jgi:hypothetical protein